MQSLGEMSSLYPTPGAFTELAGRFVDPAVSVGLGWNYWYLVGLLLDEIQLGETSMLTIHSGPPI